MTNTRGIDTSRRWGMFCIWRKYYEGKSLESQEELTPYGLSAGLEECFPQYPRTCNKDLNKDLWRRLRDVSRRLVEDGGKRCSPLRLVENACGLATFLKSARDLRKNYLQAGGSQLYVSQNKGIRW